MATTELSRYEVEDRILAALKKRGGEATAADVSAETGIGYARTETALRRMLSVYKSHLDVDDDGHLRYRFDPGFVRRGEDRGRLWHEIKKKAWKAFTLFFKVWIMVTLVGYTVIFLLLLLALAVGGIAASASSNNDRVGGGLIRLPLYLFARAMEYLFWISLFDDGTILGGGRRRGRMKRKKKKPDKAFYQKVFDYVFGPEAKSDPLGARRAFAQFVRARNGRVTAADWASRTGQSLGEAENALTAGLVRFDGDVDVTDDGELVYRFDELRVTVDDDMQTGRDLPPIWQRRATVPEFTGNPSSTNWWISIFNTFNLIMAGGVLTLAPADVPLGVTIGLGIVPLVFSIIFFAVPGLRSIAHGQKKARAEHENARRSEIGKVYESARDGSPEKVALSDELADEIARDFEGDVEVLDDGRIYYFFGSVASQLEAGAHARQAARDEVVFGQTVFSSDEEEKSLEESELEDFDRRLARELEGSHVEFDVSVAEPVAAS